MGRDFQSSSKYGQNPSPAVPRWHSPPAQQGPAGTAACATSARSIALLCVEGLHQRWHVVVARGGMRDPCQSQWPCPSHVVTRWGSTWHLQGPGRESRSLPMAVGIGEAIDSAVPWSCAVGWPQGGTPAALSSRGGLGRELMLGKRGAEHPWGWLGSGEPGVPGEPVLQRGCGCGREGRDRV